MNRPHAAVIAAPSPLFRKGLGSQLIKQNPHRMIMEVDHLDSLQALTSPTDKNGRYYQPKFKLLVVDRCLPGLSTYQQLLDLAESTSASLLLMAECTEPAFLSQAYRRGIKGLISKSATADQFIEAIDAVCQGHSWYWPSSSNVT